MSEASRKSPRRILDKDLDRLDQFRGGRRLPCARPDRARAWRCCFLALAAIFASVYVFDEPRAASSSPRRRSPAYMALNIGANDVANNVGPAVGARVITMGGALVMAAIFETAGALACRR